MGFAQAIRTCFGKYVTFSGRATRREYWWFALFCVLGDVVASMLDAAVFGASGATTNTALRSFETATGSQGPIEGLFWLATLLPGFAVGWRRMHDTGRSGLHLFLPLLVIIGLVIAFDLLGGVSSSAAKSLAWLCAIAVVLATLLILWWLTRPSQPFPNQYGPNPLEVSS